MATEFRLTKLAQFVLPVPETTISGGNSMVPIFRVLTGLGDLAADLDSSSTISNDGISTGNAQQIVVAAACSTSLDLGGASAVIMLTLSMYPV